MMSKRGNPNQRRTSASRWIKLTASLLAIFGSWHALPAAAQNAPAAAPAAAEATAPRPQTPLRLRPPLKPPPAAAAAPAPTPNKGDTAWMLTSTALVLLMSVPALALFYGGLVRKKNMLSVLIQVFVIFSLITVLWCVYGYSLAFTEGNSFIGGFSRLFLNGTFDSAPARHRSRWARPSARARRCTSWCSSPSRPRSPPSRSA